MSERPARTCDVLVIGGGPGGSAVATFLAQAGLEVVLVEKDTHPRFHIGESLLPHSLPILARLGVLDRVRGIGMFKPGAEFVSQDGTKNPVYLFERALDGGPDHAYQVRRAEFDQILFERARAAGALGVVGAPAAVERCDD
ncbi:MAG: FAD-dependent oxidoreductase, partial [Tistlia sp.]